MCAHNVRAPAAADQFPQFAEEQFNGVLHDVVSNCPLLSAFASLSGRLLLFTAPGSCRKRRSGRSRQAYDKKLAAKNLDDLAQVIDLCESALKKGLDAANAKSANSLLAGVLMERASLLTRAIVTQDIKNWPECGQRRWPTWRRRLKSIRLSALPS